ncbi:MAG: hypothetical protein D6753_16375 [Planctomycetota bacterium]|nr:MAG: hypothetical protein D6753_16375 [Planctomycetota bacterium]
MELQWRTCGRTSAWHWAWAVAHGLPIHGDVPPELKTAADSMQQLAKIMDVPEPRLWHTVIGLAPLVSRPTDLVQRTLVRLLPSAARTTTRIEALTAIARQVESAFGQAAPQFESEIGLRVGPIKHQWQEHGPGLMRHIETLMGADLLVERAEVVLVQPLTGGFGLAHLDTNRVHLEAVLTNPTADLPETLRLAWLLTQLDLDRPVYSDNVHRDRLHRLAALAMLAPTLAAAQELGLTTFDAQRVAQAITQWRLESTDPQRDAAVVVSWWETFQNMQPTVAIGLVALDRLLETENPS